MNAAQQFLEACRPSSEQAYEELRKLLLRLEDPDERGEARRLLAAVEAAELELGGPEVALERFHFSVRSLQLGWRSRSGAPLTLLQLPSVFAPEEWSRTFFEGLARVPQGELEGRTLAELGCGNGWVAIALARRPAPPERIYGLDLNPKAILCARINLFLNALSPTGELLTNADGSSLLDRVEFLQSDLLAAVRARGLELDRVIGCIPQVLHPDLATLDEVSEGASDEFLVSLSNYTGRQGFLEDQFGLGLVARALEEAIAVMRPHGKILLILGGRPGRSLLSRLFARRGFEANLLWSTKIAQAADTDVSQLAEIETRSSHRFEFFLSLDGDEPVSARTANAYAATGGEIFHSLNVFEAGLRIPEPTRNLFSWLETEPWRQARGSLDLGFDDAAVAEEKTTFLAHLALWLQRTASFPYGPTAGSGMLREHLAEFLELYFQVPLGAESLLVLPDRRTTLAAFATLFQPSLSLVHGSLAGFGGAGGEVLECPTQSELAAKLILALEPQLVATALDEHEMRSPDAFLRLVEATGRAGARLVVDVSPHFELKSENRSNGVFRAIARAPLPDHVAILCGLVKNQVYADLELAFLLAENQTLLQALGNVAELTYSRAPLLTQEYYGTIFAELLSFRLGSHGLAGRLPRRQPRPEAGAVAARVPLAASCRKAFQHPSIVAETWPRTAATVRMDYGENELPAPAFAKLALFEAFAERELSAGETDARAEIALFLRRRFGLRRSGGDHAPRLVFGLGVAPLFAALAAAAAAEDGTFVFPAGAYGYFAAAVELAGGRRAQVATSRANGFKLTADELDSALSRVSRPWLYLNGPVVNPTGSVYDDEEMAALLAVAARHRARVVLDVVFSGLERERPEPWDLGSVLAAHTLELVVLGGISKELAAGGLRFGFAWCQSDDVERILRAGAGAMPHGTMLAAARRIVAGLNRPTPAIRKAMDDQRRALARRADELAAVLTECGWEPLVPQGGLFLAARPTAYLGKRLTLTTPTGEKTFVLDGETLAEALFLAVDLLVNGSVWTGLPEHCRFVYAVDDAAFAAGLERLRRFRDLVL